MAPSTWQRLGRSLSWEPPKIAKPGDMTIAERLVWALIRLVGYLIIALPLAYVFSQKWWGLALAITSALFISQVAIERPVKRRIVTRHRRMGDFV